MGHLLTANLLWNPGVKKEIKQKEKKKKKIQLQIWHKDHFWRKYHIVCHCQSPLMCLGTESFLFFHLAFFPKDVTQYLPLQIRVRILCYRNKVCNKKISFMSFYTTFSKPKQMTVLGLQATPDKLGPGRSAKLLAVETIGHLETSLASLLCEIGVGNFWRRGTGGGKERKERNVCSSRANSRCTTV